MGFIPGRHIQDADTITHEYLQKISVNQRKDNIIIKLDMEKAFDRLDWNFLFKVMEALNSIKNL